jgi:hypothetical protein
LPRRTEIEAAIAAYNRDDRELLLLPPDAARLLALMFPRGTVCRRSIVSLVQEDFDKGTLRKLLNSLSVAGFVSKEMSRRGIVVTYRLHLPPRRQP